MSDVKLMRKQILNVLQDKGAELLTTEVYKKAFQELKAETEMRLKVLDTQVKESLARMEQRQKDVQDMLMRALFTQSAETPKDQAQPVSEGVEEKSVKTE